MASYDLTRLKRLTIIYRVIQVAIFGLMLFMAYSFMILFARQGTPDYLLKSMIVAAVVQILLLYPSWLLAGRDLSVEVETAMSGITPEQLVILRRRRLMGDLWKAAVLGFFITFIILVPDSGKGAGATLILASTLFSFLLITLTYLQCFNLRAARRQKEL